MILQFHNKRVEKINLTNYYPFPVPEQAALGPERGERGPSQDLRATGGLHRGIGGHQQENHRRGQK